jgi:hypothetical protein
VTRLLLLAALVQQDPCAQFPLAPAASWTYRVEVAWTPIGSADVQRRTLTWTTTVLTVQESRGAVVATVRGWLSDLAWWEPDRPAQTSVLACRAGRVHLLRPGAGDPAALADALVAGGAAPASADLILELPLRTGALFGRDAADRADTFYAWYVESAAPLSADVSRLQPGLTDSAYTVVYRTMPDHQTVQFVPGLGVAAYEYSHHGTVAHAEAVLIAYVPGRR